MERTVTSASNMHRRFACLGSANMERNLPDVQSDDAYMGTDLHRLYADPTLDRSHLEPDNLEVLESAEKMTADFALWLAKEYPGATFRTMREVELPLRISDKDVIKNHADVLMVSGDIPVVVVIDAKFGRRGAAPAGDNHQIHTYLTAAVENYALDMPDRTDFVGVIIAPWQSRELKPVILCMGEIDLYKKALIYNSNAAKDPDAPRTASLNACRYCKAKQQAVCPEARAFALEPVKLISENPNAGLAVSNPKEFLQSLEPQTRTKLLDAFEMAESLRASIRDGARELLALDQTAIPGYKVGKPGEMEKITDMVTLSERLSRLGVTLTATLRASTMSKKNLATIVKAGTELKGKALDETLETILKGVVDKPPTAGKLMRE